MNEQDKKAFEDWAVNVTPDSNAYFSIRVGAQAACEYKDKQLAARDAVIAKLREALDTMVSSYRLFVNGRSYKMPAALQHAEAALAIPSDNSALQEALKQAKREGQAEMRERAAKVCDSRRRTISHNGLSMWATDAGSIEAGYCADEIRALPIEGENE